MKIKTVLIIEITMIMLMIVINILFFLGDIFTSEYNKFIGLFNSIMFMIIFLLHLFFNDLQNKKVNILFIIENHLDSP